MSKVRDFLRRAGMGSMPSADPVEFATEAAFMAIENGPFKPERAAQRALNLMPMSASKFERGIAFGMALVLATMDEARPLNRELLERVTRPTQGVTSADLEALWEDMERHWRDVIAAKDRRIQDLLESNNACARLRVSRAIAGLGSLKGENMGIQTDVEDLTDTGVEEVLGMLCPGASRGCWHDKHTLPAWATYRRDMLRELVKLFDTFCRENWPNDFIHGLPAVEQIIGKEENPSDNPWSRSGFNLTKQMELIRHSPAEAERLKKLAYRDEQVAA